MFRGVRGGRSGGIKDGQQQDGEDHESVSACFVHWGFSFARVGNRVACGSRLPANITSRPL